MVSSTVTKRTDVKYYKQGRIVIVEDFRIMDTIYERDRNEIVHTFFSDHS